MPTNHADFEPLLSLLTQQLAQYRQVLVLVEEQRQSIIKNDAEQLTRLVRNQGAQLRQLATLEKKRLAATAALSAALALPERPHTLSELLPYAPDVPQQALQGLLDEFAELLGGLKVANDTNKLLLQTNIELNELMLSLLVDNEDPLNNFYRGDGSEAEERPAGPNLFDHQV